MFKYIFIFSLFLSGCAVNRPPEPLIDNPFDKFSFAQLARVPASALCGSLGNPKYKQSNVVVNELGRRQYHDCSSSELFCRENLGLGYGTEAFAKCRVEREQYELNQSNSRFQRDYLMQLLLRGY